jgi:hypothetical protein
MVSDASDGFQNDTLRAAGERLMWEIYMRSIRAQQAASHRQKSPSPDPAVSATKTAEQTPFVLEQSEELTSRTAKTGDECPSAWLNGVTEKRAGAIFLSRPRAGGINRIIRQHSVGVLKKLRRGQADYVCPRFFASV